MLSGKTLNFIYTYMSNEKIRLISAKEIPEGTALLFTLPSGEEIALFHNQGGFYALNNSCPHQGGPLVAGDVEKGVVTCPWHGWQFSLKTGDCITGGESCTTYQVIEEDGVLYLKTPTPPE